MADAQGYSPGDTGYDPTTDPDSSQYGQPPAAQPTPPVGNGLPSTPWLPSQQGTGVPAETFGPDFGPNANWGKPEVLNAYFQSRGKTPLPTSIDSWIGYWNDWGHKDPNYFYQRLQQAEEFGGGGQGGGAQGQVDPYTSLTTPAGLQTPYTAERFQGPTLDDLLKSPGYDVGLDTTFKGIERKQASQGSILDGGARQALIKGGQDYAKRSYGDLYNQYLSAYQANGNQNLGARQQNNNEFQQAVGNNLNQYNTRYKTYKDAIDNSFNLADLGGRATQAGAPA